MRHVISAVFTAIVFALSGAAHAQAPQGYPADYAKIVDAAKKEGKVIISSTTDAVAANPLIKDFETLYPGIKVEYSDLNSTELYNRFIAEAAANNGTADMHLVIRDGSAGEARRRRSCRGLRLAGNQGAAEMGSVEGFGLRHDL